MSSQLLTYLGIALLIYLVYHFWKQRTLGSRNQQQGEEFLEQNGAREEVICTPSGLQYEILQAGQGDTHPSLQSEVTVHYTGKLLSGKEFDSSVKRDKPLKFRPTQVIKGWQEGLQYMVEGQKVRLYIPSELAYGKRGNSAIPPSSVLIFDIELLSIQ